MKNRTKFMATAILLGILVTIARAAPVNSVVVDDTGKVGIGTDLPENQLHLVRGDGTAQLKITESSSGNNVRTLFNLDCVACTPAFRFKQASTIWFFRMLQNGDFSVDFQGQSGIDFKFQQGGNMTILGSLSQQSSRSSKEEISHVDPETVLAKVLSLPIRQWSYKHDDGKIRHIGPMSEDFYASFEIGESPSTLSSLDTGGVALAAIQGLKKEIEKRDKKIEKLEESLKKIEDMITAYREQPVEKQALVLH